MSSESARVRAEINKIQSEAIPGSLIGSSVQTAPPKTQRELMAVLCDAGDSINVQNLSCSSDRCLQLDLTFACFMWSLQMLMF